MDIFSKKFSIIDDFPLITREIWNNKIQEDLKDKNFTKEIVWKTDEGFELLPFYLYEDIKNLPDYHSFLLSKNENFETINLGVQNIITIDSSYLHNSHINVVLEIAFTLNMIVDYLDQLTEKKFVISDIPKKIEISVLIGTNFFMEIAKLRALKVLMQFIIKSYNLTDKNFFVNIHAETSQQSTTISDPYINIVQNTSEAISAIIGGCNSLTINGVSLEMGRNISNILKEESYFNRVIDPMGGSYFIETLTHNLIEKSYELLKKIKPNFNNKLNISTIESENKLYQEEWETPEKILIKSIYTYKDIEQSEFLYYGAGIPPFLRGPYSTMYLTKPWTIRQYAGFSTAEESNAFYKKNLAAGQTGLSIAFDLPTNRGYDSDHPRVIADVGKSGVAIDSILDMKILFDGIPLDKISVSMTMNGAVIPIMAFYIVTAIEQGVSLDKLSGTIQNDILKEFMVRNTYIYPPQPSMRIISDIIQYVSKNMPKFNSISISGYHMQEGGASADIELAYTLANGLEYLRTGLRAGLNIDQFAPQISFFWGIGMNYFMEIAKLRAARLIWAKLVKQFNPSDPKSMSLRTHCQTSGWSLTEQDPFNNISRICIEAMAAIFGHTQSLHTNSFDEAIALPTDFSAKIARDTQIYLQEKTEICKTIDPWGGAYYIEYLTMELAKKAWGHIQEIESLGGMTKAIEMSMPKLRIEESAAKKQARIDSGKDVIVGVNKYQTINPSEFNFLEIDSLAVRESQIKRLNKLKTERNEQEVKTALDSITKCAETCKGNLLEKAIIAASKKATLGEISYAMEKVFGRYIPEIKSISGIYSSETFEDKLFVEAKTLTENFLKIKGHKPRIMIAKIGQDGHDRGAKVIGTIFADLGFEVNIGSLFQTPHEVVLEAIKNNTDIIGVSILVASHKILIPQLLQELRKLSNKDIIVIAGGIIPLKDYAFLYKEGVAEIFGTGTIIPEAAIKILKKLL